MKNKLIEIFSPFGEVSKNTMLIILIVEITLLMLFWSLGTFTFLPKPIEIFNAYPELFRRGLIADFWVSLKLCVKAIVFATIISMLFSYLSTIPVSKYISYAVTKGRFFSSVGFSFFFTLLTSSGSGLKTGMLVAFITVVFTTALNSNIKETEEFRYFHARTLKLNKWETLWHVIVRGKLDKVFEFMRQNFAIAWMLLTMVEGLVRSEGGIGVMLLNENRVLRLENIFAIQFLIFGCGIALDWFITEMRIFFCPYSNLSVLKH